MKSTLGSYRRTSLPFLLLLFSTAVCRSGDARCDWLLSNHLELYTFLLRAPGSTNLAEKLQEGFHRFAFEYWLLFRTNMSDSSPQWHGYVRDMLHSEAANEKYFKDPALLYPHFQEGKLIQSFDIVPVYGLSLDGLTENSYRTLVERFQAAFTNFKAVFPSDQIPSDALIRKDNGSHREEIIALQHLLAGKEWPSVRADRLPWMLQDKPFEAFSLMTPSAQAYFIPAFLRMCELEPKNSRNLAHEIASFVVDSSVASQQFRSQLSKQQKACIFTFFENWYADAAPINRMRKLLLE